VHTLNEPPSALPLHTLLSDSDVEYICENMKNVLGKVLNVCGIKKKVG